MKKIMLMIVGVIFISIISYPQYPTEAPLYRASLENDSLTAPNRYEFDIVIKHTGGGSPFECQGIQIGLTFNQKISNRDSLIAEYIEGTSEFEQQQTPTHLAISRTSSDTGVFKVAPKAILEKGKGTIIPPNGKRYGRFRISTKADSFKPNEPINLNWNFSNTMGKYPTKISTFITEDESANIVKAREITVNSNHINLLKVRKTKGSK